MMEIAYQVPRQLYIALLADMIRKNDRRPIRIFTALLLTVGQMAVVILLCIFRLEEGQRLFFLGWSVLLAALTLLRRCTVKQRANGTLQRLEYTNQLPEDYWKEHKLRTTGQELRLSYGTQRLSCPLHGISSVVEKGEALYLYCGETIFDIVPESAFRDAGAMKKWAENLRKMASDAKAPEDVKKSVQADGVSWILEERDFAEGQYQAYRALYYRYRFLRTATFVRLAVSVAAVIGLMNDRSAVNAALCVALLVLANLENISMVPFICRFRIRRELQDWKGGREYHLALQEGTIVFSSDTAQAEIPIHKINLCQELGPWYLIAWNNFPAVVIPREIAQTAAAPLLEKIRALYQG